MAQRIQLESFIKARVIVTGLSVENSTSKFTFLWYIAEDEEFHLVSSSKSILQDKDTWR